MTTPKVPLLATQSLSEFGDLTEAAGYYDPSAIDRDATYVPGYSEQQRKTATELAEYQQGKRARQDVSFPEARLRWARNQNKAGQTDTTKPFSHGNKGYRLATESDVGQSWLTHMPPGATKMADGSIRRGDTVLMVCSQKDAAKNELVKRVRTEERMTGAESTYLKNLQEAGASVEKLDKDQPLFAKKSK